MNEYKESLQVDTEYLLENAEIKEAKNNLFDEEVRRYREFYDNPDHQEYLKNLMAAIMLVQNRRYPNYLINISSRFKAPKSIKSKVKRRLDEADMAYDKNGNNLEIASRPLLDAFAMKITSKRTPLIFYSTDQYVNDLIRRRDENQDFLREMQKFKAKLIYDDFTDRENFRLRHTVTKIEYYENCQKLLDALRSSIPSEETDLLASYEAKLKDIENRLRLLNATPLENSPEAIFNEDDLKNNDINFFDLLTDYEERYNNNVEIYMATVQFLSLFENSKIFEELGVSVDYSRLEEKRAKSGRRVSGRAGNGSGARGGAHAPGPERSAAPGRGDSRAACGGDRGAGHGQNLHPGGAHGPTCRLPAQRRGEVPSGQCRSAG